MKRNRKPQLSPYEEEIRMIEKNNRYALASLIISILAILMPVIVYVVKSILTA